MVATSSGGGGDEYSHATLLLWESRVFLLRMVAVCCFCAPELLPWQPELQKATSAARGDRRRYYDGAPSPLENVVWICYKRLLALLQSAPDAAASYQPPSPTAMNRRRRQAVHRCCYERCFKSSLRQCYEGAPPGLPRYPVVLRGVCGGARTLAVLLRTCVDAANVPCQCDKGLWR
jgi:hypothetical protein